MRLMTNIISFPGLGIGPMTVNRVAFSVGPFTVYWYGLIICFGLILGICYLYYRMRFYGMTSDDLTDVALFAIPSAIVGARLYYVLTSLEEYHSFYDVIAIWEGGIAIYGAVIAGAVSVYIVCKCKKLPVLKVFDSISPAVMLGQIAGRWGNFFNAEAYGVADRYEFFGLSLDITRFSETNPLRMIINGMTVHPTFLYESLWNTLGFVLINIFWNKKKFDGQVLLWYLSWYGLGRSIIEGFRGDSLYVGTVRISQLVGITCFIAGTVLTAVFSAKTKKKTTEE